MNYYIILVTIAVILPASQAIKCYTTYYNATSKTENTYPNNDRCYTMATFDKNGTLVTKTRGAANSTDTAKCTQSCKKNPTDATKHDCAYCCAGDYCIKEDKKTMADFQKYYPTSDATKATGMATAVLSLVYLSVAIIMN